MKTRMKIKAEVMDKMLALNVLSPEYWEFETPSRV